MSQGVVNESGHAVAPARDEIRAGSGTTHKWVPRLLVLAGLLIYFGSFFLTAIKQRGDSFGGAFCAYYTLVWPWTDGLAQMRDQTVAFFSMMFSGWVNPTFLLICIMPTFAPLRKFSVWVLKPLWVVFALSCWVVFVKNHLTPSWGYFAWTLGMVMVLFRGPLAMVFRTARTKAV